MSVVSCAHTNSDDALSIVNVTAIDAKLGVRHDQTVVVDGDKITIVGPSADVTLRGRTIDGRGMYLIPGLWDMHVHFTFDERFTYVMPGSFIEYGVTSVRDTGGVLEKLLPAVKQIREGQEPAPRIFFSGPLLDGKSPVYDGTSAPRLGVSNGSPTEALQNVERLVEAGASFIKIYEMVEPDVFDALVKAANAHGLPIAAHVPLTMIASVAGPRVDSMEHLRNVELDCSANSAQLLAERREMLRSASDKPAYATRQSIHQAQRRPAITSLDTPSCNQVLESLRRTIQVPTAGLNTISAGPPSERADWQQALERMPEAIQLAWSRPPDWLDPDPAKRDQSLAHFTLDMIRRMHNAGVPIGAGTDTPIGRAIPGYSLHHELEVLVDAGLEPLEALRAATIRPAEFFDLDDEMGTIEKGKRADLVLLTDNPLEDIRNSRSIRLVIAKGKVAFSTTGP